MQQIEINHYMPGLVIKMQYNPGTTGLPQGSPPELLRTSLPPLHNLRPIPFPLLTLLEAYIIHFFLRNYQNELLVLKNAHIE